MTAETQSGEGFKRLQWSLTWVPANLDKSHRIEGCTPPVLACRKCVRESCEVSLCSRPTDSLSLKEQWLLREGDWGQILSYWTHTMKPLFIIFTTKTGKCIRMGKAKKKYMLTLTPIYSIRTFQTLVECWHMPEHTYTGIEIILISQYHVYICCIFIRNYVFWNIWQQNKCLKGMGIYRYTQYNGKMAKQDYTSQFRPGGNQAPFWLPACPAQTTPMYWLRPFWDLNYTHLFRDCIFPLVVKQT